MGTDSHLLLLLLLGRPTPQRVLAPSDDPGQFELMHLHQTATSTTTAEVEAER